MTTRLCEHSSDTTGGNYQILQAEIMFVSNVIPHLLEKMRCHDISAANIYNIVDLNVLFVIKYSPDVNIYGNTQNFHRFESISTTPPVMNIAAPCNDQPQIGPELTSDNERQHDT